MKLSDFGIASLFASTHLTVTGSIVGTAEYLSPEQAMGKPVTRRSDLYALGVVLYTLLTGRTPFTGEPADLLHKHCYAQFDRPARVVPELPADLDALVCELLEKDPAQRPSDAGVLQRRLERVRHKMERKAQAATDPLSPPETLSDPEGAVPRIGPATLLSRLMRQELASHHGPVRRFVERPFVLLTLFLTTLGLIVWTLWPLSAETLYQRGADLMASSEPADWETAWDKYLGPLEVKHPDHDHKAELVEFKRRLDNYHSGREAERAARQSKPMSEAQWFYERGLRHRQEGSEVEARRVWKALATAFKEVPPEMAWVKLAEKRLAEEDAKGVDRKWKSLDDAVLRAKNLRAEGKEQEASAVIAALKELYSDDPEALKKLAKD